MHQILIKYNGQKCSDLSRQTFSKGKNFLSFITPKNVTLSIFVQVCEMEWMLHHVPQHFNFIILFSCPLLSSFIINTFFNSFYSSHSGKP